MPRSTQYSRNLSAFLDMLAWSEGTAGIGDDGYNVIVGSTKTQAILFSSYASHPRLDIRVRRDDPATPKNEELVSTAAGRYQLLGRYFEPYRVQLGLPDFGPASQDAIAVQQIRECRALGEIELGDLAGAISRCARIWASLPSAGYGQHEHKLTDLRAAFTKAGGIAA